MLYPFTSEVDLLQKVENTDVVYVSNFLFEKKILLSKTVQIYFKLFIYQSLNDLFNNSYLLY